MSSLAEQPDSLTDRQRRRGLLFLALAVACLGAGMAIQQGLNENYLVNEIKVGSGQRGVLEALRETAGLTGFAFLALLAGLAEPVVGFFMLILVGVGVGAYCFAPTYWWVVGMGMLWSQGLHIWMPLPSSMALALSDKAHAGRGLGRLASFSAIGSAAGLLAGAVLMHVQVLRVRPAYLLAAVMIILAAACCLMIPRGIKTPGPRLVFRRKYWLYYLLCFMDGCRKQIFLCFAPFLLVRERLVAPETMLWLWLTASVIGYFFNPLAGRLIDRFGERRTVTFYFASLTTVFIGYAFIPYIWVLFALFVVDSVFFVFNNGITVYANRIAPPEERTATLSMGVAANHVAAVSMPLLGGLLWSVLGYQWCFLAGSAAAIISVPVALLLPGKTPPAEAPPAIQAAQVEQEASA